MRIAALTLALAACSSSPTQILVEVDSDLFAPDEIDRLTIRAQSPAGRVQSAEAALGRGELPLPRVLTLAHTEGPLGPFDLTVRAEKDGVQLVERRASVSFIAGEIRVLRLTLPRSCIGETCGEDQQLTCAPGGCRSVAVAPAELERWNGRAPRLDAAGIDACVPDERCNGIDDDCDGATDESFDLQRDEAHCGGCNIGCDASHASAACMSGRCVIQSCEPPFADCDDDATNGCETDTSASPRHCGGCGVTCGNPNRDCCGGTCGRC